MVWRFPQPPYLLSRSPSPRASRKRNPYSAIVKKPKAVAEIVKRVAAAKDHEAEGARIAREANAAVDWLADVAAIAPLVGLLGTVLGMFKAFGGIASDVAAGAKPVVLAQGVSQAIVTTILGLAVAIPSLVAYAVMRRRAAKRISELEAAAEEVLAGGVR